MDRQAAIVEIKKIFSAYRSLTPSDQRHVRSLKNGKLYELYVLAYLVDHLTSRGFRLSFQGQNLKLKASPGQIKLTDPHFRISAPGSSVANFYLFVDIEFDTLGHSQIGASDKSRRHELDIVVVTVTSGYPQHTDIALAVECKAVANFEKNIVKEVLGVRRELSLLAREQSSVLSIAGGTPAISVGADPPSEFLLAFIDPKGKDYSDSPSVFGIEFLHLEPK